MDESRFIKMININPTLIENIKNENPSYIDKFIYGSVFKNKFIEE